MRDNAIGINVEGFHFSYLPFVFLGYQVNIFFFWGFISIFMGRRARAFSPEEVDPPVTCCCYGKNRSQCKQRLFQECCGPTGGLTDGQTDGWMDRQRGV